MQTVVELKTFTKRAAKLFNDEELKDFIDFIALNPFAGDEIPGTGGVKKVRFGAKGKGKSGGARVIYYVLDALNPIYLLTCYGKGEKGILTPEEKKQVSAFATLAKAEARKKKR